MLALLLSLSLISSEPSRSDHGDNPVLRGMITTGLVVNGTKVTLPEPTLGDAQTLEGCRATLKAVVGDDRAVKEFLRDSVTAPFVLKTRDIKAGDATVRVADLWFAVHARLEDVDLDQAIQAANDQAVEVANMRVESKRLADPELLARQIQRPESREDRKEWYTHLTGRLLDRILVETTDHVIATRSADSLVIATSTDHAFDPDPRLANHWATLTRKGNQDLISPRQPYAGASSYVKLTRLTGEPDLIFVESHFLYVEPQEWFQGNPILRSKFGLMAQDQIRRLRREIAKKQVKK